MSSPSDLRFTRTHEWVRIDGDVATIGISDRAQQELGDITYVELPEPGTSLTRLEPLGIIESVKAASDIYAPIDGEVVERNDAVVDAPDSVNASPYGDAWLLKVKIADPSQTEQLLSAEDYDQFAETATPH